MGSPLIGGHEPVLLGRAEAVLDRVVDGRSISGVRLGVAIDGAVHGNAAPAPLAGVVLAQHEFPMNWFRWAGRHWRGAPFEGGRNPTPLQAGGTKLPTLS